MFVCAMALPKQVILIPLLKEMAWLRLHNTLWAVILPTVGWPFGVFLMKQFSENIPRELLEAARIDGAGEARTFVEIVLPLIKPGIGALAIFTFITAWNDYFLQLIMLNDTKSAEYLSGKYSLLATTIAKPCKFFLQGFFFALIPNPLYSCPCFCRPLKRIFVHSL